jgi:hypothetical protein
LRRLVAKVVPSGLVGHMGRETLSGLVVRMLRTELGRRYFAREHDLVGQLASSGRLEESLDDLEESLDGPGESLDDLEESLDGLGESLDDLVESWGGQAERMEQVSCDLLEASLAYQVDRRQGDLVVEGLGEA